jgi:hypothetical protein
MKFVSKQGSGKVSSKSQMKPVRITETAVINSQQIYYVETGTREKNGKRWVYTWDGNPYATTLKRAPSAYNQFMSRGLEKYKLKHPDVDHKTAFAHVAKKYNKKKSQLHQTHAILTKQGDSLNNNIKDNVYTDDEEGESKTVFRLFIATNSAVSSDESSDES